MAVEAISPTPPARTPPYLHATQTGQPYNYDDQELSEQWMRTLAGDDALQSTVTQKREMVEAQVHTFVHTYGVD